MGRRLCGTQLKPREKTEAPGTDGSGRGKRSGDGQRCKATREIREGTESLNQNKSDKSRKAEPRKAREMRNLKQIYVKKKRTPDRETRPPTLSIKKQTSRLRKETPHGMSRNTLIAGVGGSPFGPCGGVHGHGESCLWQRAN